MRPYAKSILTLFALVTLGMATVPAQAMDGWGVEVCRDVEVFDQPGGEGSKYPEDLKAGSWVILYEEREDHWCHVGSKTDPVPGGKGWVWCGVGNDGEDYSLRKLTAEEVNSPKPTQGEICAAR